MKSYIELAKSILARGENRADRTGTGTMELFSTKFEHNMSDGFPLLTTKKMHLRSIIHELLWFIKGDTNIAYLKENGVSIWDEWADKQGNLGPVYGHQWRHCTDNKVEFGKCLGDDKYEAIVTKGCIDQLAEAIDKIKNNPTDRRIRVSSWNVAEIADMKLPPCHYEFTFYVHNDGTLDLKWKQRSVDVFLGLPFNIASYALLLLMVAQVTGKKPGTLLADLDCTHIYVNHIEQITTQIARKPYKLPTMLLNPAITCIDDFTFEDFTLSNYTSHSKLTGKVAV